MYIYVLIRIFTGLYIYMYIYIYMCVCVCVYVCVYDDKCIYRNIYIDKFFIVLFSCI